MTEYAEEAYPDDAAESGADLEGRHPDLGDHRHHRRRHRRPEVHHGDGVVPEYLLHPEVPVERRHLQVARPEDSHRVHHRRSDAAEQEV